MGRPKGSKNKPKDPSAPKRRGRPPGSKNKPPETPPKRRGRPPGSKNKPKDAVPPAAAVPAVPKRRGRPPGSKNKPKDAADRAAQAAAVAAAAPPKRRGRPPGSKNKPKDGAAVVPEVFPPARPLIGDAAPAGECATTRIIRGMAAVAAAAQAPGPDPVSMGYEVKPVDPTLQGRLVIVDIRIEPPEIVKPEPQKPEPAPVDSGTPEETVPAAGPASVAPTPPVEAPAATVSHGVLHQLSREHLETVANQLVGKPVMGTFKNGNKHVVGEVKETWVDGNDVRAKIYLSKEDRHYTTTVYTSVVG